MKRQLGIGLTALMLGSMLCGCPAAVITRTPPAPDQQPLLGTGETETVVANLEGSIDSYLMFGCLPLLTGNANRPNSATYKAFGNMAQPAIARTMLESYGEALGADRVVIRSVRERSSGWMTLWLFWHKVVTVSGEAVDLKKAP